jgi:hypothetical protein
MAQHNKNGKAEQVEKAIRKSNSKANKDKPTSGRMIFAHISPEMAQEWLESDNNLNYRRHNAPHSMTIATAIKNNEWEVTGDVIRFDSQGCLRDGQHRLYAISSSGVGVWSWVYIGIRNDFSLDRHRRRTLSDSLRREGEVDANCLASMLNYLWRQENDMMSPSFKTRPSIPAALNILHADRSRIRTYLTKGGRLKSLASQSAMAFAWYMIAQADEEGSDEFFESVRYGTGLQKEEPVWALRRRLENNRLARHDKRVCSEEVIAITFKAWQSHCLNKPIKTLVWKAFGKGAEEFPGVYKPDKI